MKRFKIPLLYFIAGSLPLLSGKAEGVAPDKSSPDTEPLEPVKLRPLNLPHENLFAAHGSHSSHGSHRSGSGGGYAAPVPSPKPPLGVVPAPVPAPAPPAPVPLTSPSGDSSGNQPVDPGRADPVSPKSTSSPTPSLTLAEKQRLQIMRVQIALTSLGLYTGRIDGVLNPDTKSALRMFQDLKGIDATGMMTTPTLNALGVPAVQ